MAPRHAELLILLATAARCASLPPFATRSAAARALPRARAARAAVRGAESTAGWDPNGVPPPLDVRTVAPARADTVVGWEAEGVPPPRDGDFVDVFCRGVNAACRASVVGPFRAAAAIRPSATVGGKPGSSLAPAGFWEKALSPPELPPISRPAWLVIAASVPTLLGWYGWYKFSTEEELFWEELRESGRATGCGGYGTLLPFVYAVGIGGAGKLLSVPHAEVLVEIGSVWILAGQVNLYRRVNEIWATGVPTSSEIELEGPGESQAVAGGEPPLHAWWALLPPPLDVIVGLRQLHFLARRNAAGRGEAWAGDAVAETLFPFISAPRFTLRKLARTPSMWFWFTAGMTDFEQDWLKD
ncbi:hypothetical protein T492DRAFT_1090687 [Pavlovales sp. CCMP2436]|nr:hypothetical protein T492DRAFT_1090687 [Pavlovales sp. CCMP2436]